MERFRCRLFSACGEEGGAEDGDAVKGRHGGVRRGLVPEHHRAVNGSISRSVML